MQLSKPFKSAYYNFNDQMLSAVTHAFALGLSVVGTVALAFKATTTLRLVTFLGFGISLIILYLGSTLFHGFYFTKARHVLQVIDHSSVFILIAGSYLLLSRSDRWATRLGTVGRDLAAVRRRNRLQALLPRAFSRRGNRHLRDPRLDVPDRHAAAVGPLRPHRLLAAGGRRRRLHLWRLALLAEKDPVHSRHLAPVCDDWLSCMYASIYLFV